MDVSVTASKRGDVRHLTISISASEDETLDLIDALSLAGGYPEIVAGKITSVVGVIDIQSDPVIDAARSLRQIAAKLERRHH